MLHETLQSPARGVRSALPSVSRAAPDSPATSAVATSRADWRVDRRSPPSPVAPFAVRYGPRDHPVPFFVRIHPILSHPIPSILSCSYPYHPSPRRRGMLTLGGACDLPVLLYVPPASPSHVRAVVTCRWQRRSAPVPHARANTTHAGVVSSGVSRPAAAGRPSTVRVRRETQSASRACPE